MNTGSLNYALALERQRELLAQAERSRSAHPVASRLAAAALRPPDERRGALRSTLLAVLGRTERPRTG